MAQYDLEEIIGKPSKFSARSKGRSQTFPGKNICWGGLFKVIGLAATRPLPQEVPQKSKGQDHNTSDTTNYTSNDRSNGGQLRGRETGRRWGRRRQAVRGLDFGMAPTRAGGDEEVIEDELIGLVGRGHPDIDFVGPVCQFWCLEVDDLSCVSVDDWLLKSGWNAELSKRLATRPLCWAIHQKNRQFCIPQSGRQRFLPLKNRKVAPETLFPW